MLIILEGPDLAGKSTLAASLQRYLSVKYSQHTVTLLHRGPPTQHPLDEYITPLLDYVPGGDEHVICDRWHVGELVYPGVTGRTTRMTPGIYRYIEMFLQSRGAYVIHVTASDSVLRRRYEERGDTVQSLARVTLAAAAFRRFMQRSILEWTMSSDKYPLMPFEISAGAQHVERWTGAVRQFRTFVGQPNPGTVYVGDVRSKLQSQLFPAFGPYPGTSGAYLMEALPPSPDAALININDVDSPDNIATYLWGGVVVPRVVALGRRAQQALTKRGIPHTAVPHPQFVRRFHHGERGSYRHLLSLRDGKDHVSWPVTPRTSTPRPGGTRTTKSSSTSSSSVVAATSEA